MSHNRDLSAAAAQLGFHSSNIGIGSEAPRYALDVYNSNLLVSGPSAGNIILEDRGVGDSSRPFSLLSSNDGNFTITNSNRNASGTTTSSAERLRITSTGRIGINQTSPGAMLQVDYDEGSSEVGLRLRAYNASGSKTWQLSEVNGTPGVFTIRNATNAQNNLSIDGSSGYVGVNATNPDRRLEVVETASSLTFPVAVSNHTDASAGVGAGIAFHLTAGGNARGDFGVVYAGNSNSDGTDFVFRPNDGSTGSVERLRIKGSSGNIGIGTDNPGEPLHVFVGNGGNGEPIALFEHDHGSGGDASIRIEGGASGNPDEVYLELCDKDDSSNSWTMGMNDDKTRLRFEYGAKGANNGKQLLTLDQNGAARFNGASGVLRDPTIDNTSYVGLSLWPSGTGGASNYSDNHNISFTQENGNWLDGHSNTSKSSFGMVWNYTSDGTTMRTRAGIHYDHRGSERFKIWSSYGDISFKVDSGSSGNETWTTCDKEVMRLSHDGHVLRPTMAAAAVTLSADQTTLTNFSSYTTLTLNSEGFDNANNFNTSNYRFTAPETGFYNIGCNVQLENGSGSGNRWMYLYPIINGTAPTTAVGGNQADFDPADTYYYSWNWSSIMKLSKNDYVEWKYVGNLTSINLRGQGQSVFYFYQVG